MKYYLKVLQNYATFQGRARRSEYWYFLLFNMIFGCLALCIDNLFGLAWEGGVQGPIYLIYILAVALPGLAVFVRRLHDIGKSGSLIFISLIPVIGIIWLLVLLAKPGTEGSNAYGSNPKEYADPL